MRNNKYKVILIAFGFGILNTSLAVPVGNNVEYIPDQRNLGVGVINPQAKVDVNGSIMIRGGNPQEGLVLTSNVDGLASWRMVDASNITGTVQNAMNAFNASNMNGGNISNSTFTNGQINGATLSNVNIVGNPNINISRLVTPTSNPVTAVNVRTTGDVDFEKSVVFNNLGSVKAIINTALPNLGFTLDTSGVAGGWARSYNFMNNGKKLASFGARGLGSNETISYMYLNPTDGEFIDPAIAILSNKNVGIGNVLPSQKLVVNGNVLANRFIGNGSELTGIKADNISGKVANAATADFATSSGTATNAVNAANATNAATAMTLASGATTTNTNLNTPILNNAVLNGMTTINNSGIRITSSNVITHGIDSPLSGTPTNDGFRIKRVGGNVFSANSAHDFLVFEKTDGNDINPDGGIAFSNTGMDGIEVPALIIRGTSNVGIGFLTPSQKLAVNGNVLANRFIGDGSGLTGISAGNITGAVPNATNATNASNMTGGTITNSTFRNGFINGATLVNVNIPGNPSLNISRLVNPSNNQLALSINNAGATVARSNATFNSDSLVRAVINTETPNFGISLDATNVTTGNWARSYNFMDNNKKLGSFGALGQGNNDSLNYLYINPTNGEHVNPAMAFLPNLNIGMGTTNPTEKLHVVGNVRANRFIGDGSGLTGITAGNITGKVANAATADFATAAGTAATATTATNASNMTGGTITNSTIRNGVINGATLVNVNIPGNPNLNISRLVNPSNNQLALSINNAGNTVIAGDVQGMGATFSKDIKAWNVTADDNLYVRTAHRLAHNGLVQININKTATGNFRVSGNTDTNLIFANYSTNNVGLGITAPTEKLHVVGNVRANRFIGDGSGLTGITAGNITGKVANAATADFATAAGTAATATTATNASNMTGGNITNSTIRNGVINGATLVNVNIPGNPNINLSKLVSPNGSINPALQVDNLGRVGIGTTNVQNSILHVVNTLGTRITAQHIDEIGWSEFATAGVNNSGAFVRKWSVGSTGDKRSEAFGGQNKFYVFQYSDKNDNVVENYRLIIDSNGNMGVGTTNPLEKLHVVGNVRANGFIGSGQGITNLNANNIATGTINEARIPNLNASKITSGTFNASLFPVFNATSIPNLDASKITTGVFNLARIPALDLGRIPNLTSAKISSAGVPAGRVLTADGAGSSVWQVPASGADNLGNHTAQMALNMNNQNINNVNRLSFKDSTDFKNFRNVYFNGSTMIINNMNYTPKPADGGGLAGSHTAFGYDALQEYTGNQLRNTAYGSMTLRHLKNGGENTMIGAGSGTFTSGNSNTAVGSLSLWTKGGDRNTAIGAGAGRSYVAPGTPVNSISDNTFIGANAGFRSSGNSNVYIGSNAGATMLSGSRNIVVGWGVLGPDNASDYLNIGNLITGNMQAGSKSLRVDGVLEAPSIRIPTGAGAGRVLTSDAAGNATWQLPGSSGGTGLDGVTGLAIRDTARRLVVLSNPSNPTQSVRITADEIILQDNAGNGKRVANVNLTANSATTGVNGIDSGSRLANTWYHIWVVNNGPNTAALLSTNPNNPTMPAGYTFRAYVGAVYSNSSNQLLSFYQRGKRVVLDSTVRVLSGGSSTNWANVNLGPAVPVTADFVFGTTGLANWNSFQQAGVHLAATATGADMKRFVEYSEPVYTNDQPFDFSMSIRTNQSIFYRCYRKGGGCMSGGVYLDVNGWEFE
jgi:hypothetical protein